VKNENDAERKAIALAWLFHFVGDIHQPLHTAKLFNVGDRGGNEICVRVTQAGQPMDLHRFWDGVTTFRRQRSAQNDTLGLHADDRDLHGPRQRNVFVQVALEFEWSHGGAALGAKNIRTVYSR
jgi:S1/P1 Nuclease